MSAVASMNLLVLQENIVARVASGDGTEGGTEGERERAVAPNE